MWITEEPMLTLAQGAVYGKCVAASFQNVKKDMCAKEFMALKDCYLVSSAICRPCHHANTVPSKQQVERRNVVSASTPTSCYRSDRNHIPGK